MRALKRLWQAIRWLLLKVGRALGRINTVVLLTVSFYVILLPLGLARRLVGKRTPPAGWLQRPPLAPDHFKRQF
jgi:hypothetical protein